MIRTKLSVEEREELEKARNVRTSNLAERSFFVLLNDEGKSVAEIAAQTGRHEHTVRTWLKAFQESGLEGLKGSFPPGRRNKKGQALQGIINEGVEHSPVD
jgi:transposase